MAATDTNTPGYDQIPSPGLRPSGKGPQYLWQFVDDEEGLDEAGDKVRFFRFAKNTVVLDAHMVLGDHDSNGTPACLHDLALNAAVNGAAATDYNLIDAVSTGQAGGVARAGDGTAPAFLPLGRRIEADDAYLYAGTDTAPATAQTDDRSILVGVLIGDHPASPIT